MATAAVKQPKTRNKPREWVIDLPVNIFLVLVLLITLIPLWYVLMVSFTPIGKGGYNLFLSPLDWSFEAYKQLLGQDSFIRALGNSLIITIGGVIINMILTVLTAYVLSLNSYRVETSF